MLTIKNGEFVDELDRAINLRGINLGGSSKIPSNYSSTTNWQDSKTTTFVNRPFPVSEAPLHFRRIRACGYTIIRFIITWEAIEHAGPGMYDYEYIQYVKTILQIANEYKLQIYIDPHQDVWSRWTGGDGAPLWTLEKVGFDITNFRGCEAAICQETYGQGHSTAEQRNKEKKSLPKMIWPTNYFKLGAATMFTLFWAGERFAPNFTVDSGDGDYSKKVNIQTYLQQHYINAIAELLKHLNGLENIVGVGTMNEPSAGYINVDNLSKGFGQSGAASSGAGSKELKYGLAPTPFQGMCLGEGYAQLVGDYSNGIMQHVFGKPDHWVSVDPMGKKAWKTESNGCIWKQAGVWQTNTKTNQPELLRPDYFAHVDFGTECYIPFAKEYANTMRSVWTSKTQELLIFVELPPLEFSSTPFPEISSSVLSSAVNATHWYDGVTLFTRSFKSHFSVNTHNHRPVFGYKNILKMHVSQLGEIKQLGKKKMDNAPTLIGETGIPYDMIEKLGTKMIRRKSKSIINFRDSSSQQLAAMNHTMICLEKNLLSFTLWNYTSDHSNNAGDVWNGEDLSIYSEDHKCGLDNTDPCYIYDGLRAARAFVRPYAQCITGTPVVNEFDMNKGEFQLIYRVNGIKYKVPSEIFVPKLWCSKKGAMKVSVSDGKFEVEENEDWYTVKHWHSSAVEDTVKIKLLQ
mmetsp:Transcript_16388/g.26789  ORF Transcript_16388/g.26789 Transcript_16388/m.26789 type:complete len:685 (+) Transcript_16388:69-2123(+)